MPTSKPKLRVLAIACLPSSRHQQCPPPRSGLPSMPPSGLPSRHIGPLLRGPSEVPSVITDIHCHFVPERYFEFVTAEPAFGVRRGRVDGEAVEVAVGGLGF